MIFSVLSAIICLLLIAAGVFLTVRSAFRKGRFDLNSLKLNALTIVLVVVGIAGLLLVPTSFHTVETGQVAVVKHLGAARKVRGPGTYFDFCLTETYEYYDSKVQNIEIDTQAYSKDAQTMDIDMTMQYQIRTEDAIKIATNYGSVDAMANRIQAIAIEKAKDILTRSSAMEIIENRASISRAVEDEIKKAVDDNYYVNIVTVVLTNIDFSDAFEKIVEEKMIAEQEKMKAEYEKQTAIVNAEKELEVAKLEAEAKLAIAKADAEAAIAVAEAEAKAIKLKSIEVARALGFVINEKEVTVGEGDDAVSVIEYDIDFTGKSADEIALITEYLKYIEYLSKWDGKLPTVVTGDSASIMIPTDPTEGK